MTDARKIRATIEESIATKQRLAAQCLPAITALCDLAIATLRGGGKILLCGNGGSSCDAAHAAGELAAAPAGQQKGAGDDDGQEAGPAGTKLGWGVHGSAP